LVESTRSDDPIRASVTRDLILRLEPIEPVLAHLDPLLLLNPPYLTTEDSENLVTFVRTGLLDKCAERQDFCRLLLSGIAPLQFEGCGQ
jgi:hypothetical protein